MKVMKMGMVAGVVALTAGMLMGQSYSPLLIAPALQGVSNATVTVAPATVNFPGSPYVMTFPTGVQQGHNMEIVGTCQAPTNGVTPPAQEVQSNNATYYFELTYPNGSYTTSDPLSITMPATSNALTTATFLSNTNTTGANGWFCDKVVSPLSNYVYFTQGAGCYNN